MSTLSHNFYGINLVNELGEVDPLIYASVNTGFGDAVAPANAQNISYTALLSDPFGITVKDTTGYIGFRAPVTGLYLVHFTTLLTASSSQQGTYTLYAQWVNNAASSGRTATDGTRITIRETAIYLPAAGTYTAEITDQVILKRGQMVYTRFTAGAGGGTVTTGQDADSGASIRLISKDSPTAKQS